MTPIDDLSHTIAEASGEVEAKATQAAQVQASRDLAVQSPSRWKVWALGLVLLVVAVAGWLGYRLAPPDGNELALGRAGTLQLASQAVADHMRSTGKPPASVAEVLPAAADVAMQVSPEGIRLTLTDAQGGKTEAVVPAAPQTLKP